MQNVKVRTNSSSKDKDAMQVSQRTVLYPTRCPACGRRELVPDRYDPEDAMERKFAKCLTSSDPVCKTAVQSPSVQQLKDRLAAKQG
jgi:rRNA maturation protein Nop10